MKTNTNKEQLQGKDLLQLVELEQELQELKQQHGLIKEKKSFRKYISLYFEKKEERVLSVVNRKKYLYYLIFTGWCGGHHFYAKRYSTGFTYLLLFWTGFPLAMAIADWLVWLPKEPDENGMIEI